jgi:iron complex transport system substrate-binding protein
MRLIAPTALVAVLISTAAHPQPYPKRIVSAGGDLTEIVYALGAEDRVVGVDVTSNFPPSAKDKKQVGYVRHISAEGVLALEPDLVLGAHDMGPPTTIDQLRAAGVRVELAPRGYSAKGIAAKVGFVGRVLGLRDEARQLASKIEADFNREAARAVSKPLKPRVIFILSLGKGEPMVGGVGSSAAQIIELAGGTNAVTEFDGYRPMSSEAILAARPEVILIMDSTVVRYGGIDKIFERPELAHTPAGQKRRYISMDGMLLLGFGPRTPLAIEQLGEALRQ